MNINCETIMEYLKDNDLEQEFYVEYFFSEKTEKNNKLTQWCKIYFLKLLEYQKIEAFKDFIGEDEII